MTKLPCEFLVTFTQKVWYFVKSCYEHDEISYRIGDQAGVENRPLMWPTSLSISPLSSWYSLKFRYLKKATKICLTYGYLSIFFNIILIFVAFFQYPNLNVDSWWHGHLQKSHFSNPLWILAEQNFKSH